VSDNDIYVSQDPEALLLTGKTACGHLAASTFRTAWHAALKDSGCQRVRLHDLRHYAGVMTARTGAMLTENMSRLGHSTAAAPLIYQDVVARRDE
jgi:integrase